jgi:hydroxyacylglutathione hydrolase
LHGREPEVELEHGSLVHLGGFSFRVLHTPGHTSGSICLYERSRGLMFTGDTVFARGTLSIVSASGSRGDHLASLERLAGMPARMLLPGHGHVSDDPRGDLNATLAAARDPGAARIGS